MAYGYGPKTKAAKKPSGRRPTPKGDDGKVPESLRMQGAMSNHQLPVKKKMGKKK